LGIFTAIFLNPQIIRGDMKENVSGCFSLSTVYIHQSSICHNANNYNITYLHNLLTMGN